MNGDTDRSGVRARLGGLFAPVPATHRGRLYLAVRTGRDLCLLTVGVIGWFASPPSIAHFADYAGFIAGAWAWTFVLASTVSIVGVLTERPMVEAIGVSWTVAAFVVWTAAALDQTTIEPSTLQVTLVFLFAILGQGYRVLMIANQRVLR